MSRLISRNPEKAWPVGYALLSYIKANPGDLHYFKDIPNDGWGERHQLKLQRSQRSLEIFSDIAYAAGTGYRSIQGIAVFSGGSPVGAFATHSTAESELVAYCESLLIGQKQSAMWGEPLKSNLFSRVIYGDNLAAIGLANGTTCSSWSGLTKQLNGQAFFRFVEDLGMKRSTPVKPDVSQAGNERAHAGGGDGQKAMRAIMVGSLLVSSAKARDVEGTESSELTPILVTGAILMMLGAVYAGQLLCEVTQCCLKRLRMSTEEEVRQELAARRNHRTK